MVWKNSIIYNCLLPAFRLVWFYYIHLINNDQANEMISKDMLL